MAEEDAKVTTQYDPWWYPSTISKRPLCCVFAMVLIVVNFSVLVLPLGKHLSVDVALNGFEDINHYTSSREAGRRGSETNRVVNDKETLERRQVHTLAESGTGLARYTIPYTYPKWHITLIYMSESSVLTPATLSDIHAFENRIYESAPYQRAGWRDTHSPSLASGNNNIGSIADQKARISSFPPAPVSSFLQYLYPTVYNETGAVKLAASLGCCSDSVVKCPWAWSAANTAGCPVCEDCSHCTRCALKPVHGTRSGIVYNGHGNSTGNLFMTLQYIVRSQEAHDSQWFFGKDFNAHQLTTTRLRSEIVLGAPFPGFAHAGSGGQDGAVEPSVEELTRVLDTFSVEGVRLVYGGDIVTEAAILRTLKRDSCIAVASIVVVLLYMVFHLRSLFLSTCAMGQLLVTFPVSLFFYAVVFRESYLGPLNILSFYIMVGIGVDDIFVFSNAFFYCEKPSVLGEGGKGSSVFTRRDSWSITKPVFQSDSVPLEQRTAYALRKAGPPMLVTSTTSAAAFMANMISSIPAVRSFGLLMGILVIVNYLLVMSLYPTILCVWMTYIRRLCWKGSPMKGTPVHVMEGENIVAELPHDTYHVTGWGKEGCPVYKAPFEGHVVSRLSDGEVVACVGRCDGFLQVEEGWVQQRVGDGRLTPEVECLQMDDIIVNPLSIEVETVPDTQTVVTEADECHLIEGDGIPVLKRVFVGYVYPFIYRMRFVFLGVMLVSTGVFIYAATRLTHRDDSPSFYDSDHHIYIYRHRNELFTKPGDCIQKDSACAPFWGNTDMGLFLGCDNVLFSDAVVDRCGECGGNNSCVGCDGVLHSGVRSSICGVCGGKDEDCPPLTEAPQLSTSSPLPKGPSPCPEHYIGPTCLCSASCVSEGGTCTPQGCRMCSGEVTTQLNLTHRIDACRQCSDVHAFNKSCLGCDGVPGSGAVIDSCGVCGGNNACQIVDTIDTNTIVVYLLWGVDAERSWEDENGWHVVYDKHFNAADPACQTHMLHVCRNRQFLEKVQVPGLCVIQDFDTWLRTLSPGQYAKYEILQNASSQGLPLPEASFQAALTDFMITPSSETRDKLEYTGWYGQLPDEPDLKYIRHIYRTTANAYSSAFSIHDEFSFWEGVMNDINSNAPPTCRGYQTAHQWPKAFIQVIAVRGLVYSIAISMITSFVIVLMFTCHVWITTLILVTMGSIISGTFSVFWMMGWKVGAVEAVSLSVVIGLSVDYCLHFAEAYTEVCAYVRREGIPFSSEEVLRKVVGDMGPPLVNAAATTILSTVPLLFCTIRPLVQFGQIMVISIGVSIVFSVFLFVPLLLVLGPRPFKKTLRVRLVAVILPALLIAIFFAVVYASGTPIVGPDGEPLVG